MQLFLIYLGYMHAFGYSLQSQVLRKPHKDISYTIDYLRMAASQKLSECMNL